MTGNVWLPVFTLLALSIIGNSSVSDKDSYIVPSIWNGRQDWQKADLVDATDKKIIITLHNDQAKKQIEFLKNEAAIDKPLKEKDVTIGMDVLARISADMNKQPIYATGTITKRLRVSQYSVVPNCQVKALPLGVGTALPVDRVSKLEDNKLTASSAYSSTSAAKNGRLGLGEVWCPKREDARGAWLQVDLGGSHYICSVAVQGNTAKRNEWVKKYTISLSNNGNIFEDVKESGNVKEFQASRSGQESHLNLLLPYRFIRFHPREYHRYPCLGVEVYGFGPVNTKSKEQHFNLEELRAIGDSLAPYLIVPFSLKQRKDWRLAKFISQTKNDVTVKVIPGPQSSMNYDSKEVMFNVPPKHESVYAGRAVYAPFTKDITGMEMYSFGRVGMADTVGSNQVLVTPICSAIQKSLPVGVGTLEKDLVGRIDKIPDKHLTATSYKPNHEASLGRLGNSRVWCAENGKERTSRFQIDLGNPYFICSVAIQGQLDGDEAWVTTFKMSVSNDGRKWSHIIGPTGTVAFQRSGADAAEFSITLPSIAYRYVSFNPLTFYRSPCMGVELYGVGPIKDSLMFDVGNIRVQGSVCELQNKCPKTTECIPSKTIAAYTCKCPAGYMSSKGGSTIIPGTDEHCRNINPTGKLVNVPIEKMPTKRTPVS